MSVANAQNHCLELLKSSDRSSYVLKSYIPKSALNAFIGIRAFKIDLSRIVDTVTRPEIAKLRFDFWKTSLQKIYQGTERAPQEPTCLVLADAIENGVELSKRYLLTLIQTKEGTIGNPPFRTLDSMASYGEGTFSQLNYLTQESVLSVSPSAQKFLQENASLSEPIAQIAAHIGQATGIAAFLRAFKFYVGSKNFVPLPVALMTNHGLSQQEVIDLITGRVGGDQTKDILHKLSNVVYETATRANDHLLSAQSLLKQVKSSAKLPDAIFIPYLSALPVQLFLERLERTNFDITSAKLSNEWRLPYRSFKSYKFHSLS